MPLPRQDTAGTTVIPDSEEERIRDRKAAGYTSTDDDDIFFSKSPPNTHTPSRTTRIRSGKVSVKLPASKPSIKGEPIIELISDDEDNGNASPTPLRRLVRGTRPPKSKSSPTPVATPANDAMRKRKFIQSDSSSGEDFSHILDLDSDASPIRSGGDPSPPKPQTRKEEDTHTEDAYDGDNAIVDYVPTSRRPPSLFPSGTKNSKTKATNETEITSNPIRRRLTLEEVYPENEELSWETQVDAEGAVRSGAMLQRPSSPMEDGKTRLGSSPHPSNCLTPPNLRSKVIGDIVSGLKTVEGTSEGTPSKRATRTPRSPAGTTATATPSKKGKLPVEVARLHRIGLGFLKELDKKVFGGALGSQCLPDLPIDPSPVHETPKQKGRGRKPADPNPIYNMGSSGYYPDDKGTISVIWSNRMQTTAGRTEYHKNGAGIVTLKIELGVKVLTDEERLRNTIAHEACHAATYVISGDFRNQHGATWKSWTEKVMRRYPDILVSTRHDYVIDYKFNWKCAAGCGQVYHRHSNSIDITKSGCQCGSVLTPLFETAAKRTRTKKVECTSQTAANGITKPQSSPVPLETTGGRKGYSFPSSSFMVPHGHSGGCDDALIELNDSSDEEIAQLTNALGGVSI